MKLTIARAAGILAATILIQTTAVADDATTASTRYGLFNGLDHRSIYGQGYFPEPFLVDDSDLEPTEARVDWLHTAAGANHSDEVKAEVEKGFGQLTLELEIAYAREEDDGAVSEGIGNIDLGARYPFYQFVSENGFVDSTFGVAVEIGIPTQSEVSKNAELVPKIFSDVKIGDFTAQAIAGYSALFGPGDEGGLQVFEYGFVFGYPIPRRQLPLPGVLEIVPMLEITGETELNKSNPGRTALIGDAGFRVFCKAIGPVQPRLGVAFVFPMNNTAREEIHWGITTSLVFQF